GRVGDGTYVSHVLPDEALHAAMDDRRQVLSVRRIDDGRTSDGRKYAGRSISRLGSLMSAMPPATMDPQGSPRAFRPGLPALDAFPSETWASLLSRRWRNASPELLGPGDPAGYGPLREAIASYLHDARAVRCRPEQVVVTAGSQQALDLAAR